MSDDMNTMGMESTEEEKKDEAMPAMGGDEHTDEAGAEKKEEGEEGGEAGAM